jgi:hypothetical protein
MSSRTIRTVPVQLNERAAEPQARDAEQLRLDYVVCDARGERIDGREDFVDALALLRATPSGETVERLTDGAVLAKKLRFVPRAYRGAA